MISFTSEDFISNKKLFNDLLLFSSKAYVEDNSPTKDNMDVSNWQENYHTLLHALAVEKRFAKDLGRAFCMYDGNKIVAFSAVYRSDFAPEDVLLCGVRAYTLKEYRTQTLHANYLIPAELEYAKENNFKECWFTSNDFNAAVMYAMKRGVGIGLSWTKEARDRFADVIWPEGMYMIKGIPQFIAIKRLDPNFEFDYGTLKVEDK